MYVLYYVYIYKYIYLYKYIYIYVIDLYIIHFIPGYVKYIVICVTDKTNKYMHYNDIWRAFKYANLIVVIYKIIENQPLSKYV